jgi:hypothetical protein
MCIVSLSSTVTTHSTAVTETAKVKGFHPEPKRGDDNNNEAFKRVTTSAGIAAINAKALSFFSEKSSQRSRELSRPIYPRRSVGLNDPSTLNLCMRRGPSTPCSIYMVDPWSLE